MTKVHYNVTLAEELAFHFYRYFFAKIFIHSDESEFEIHDLR